MKISVLGLFESVWNFHHFFYNFLKELHWKIIKNESKRADVLVRSAYLSILKGLFIFKPQRVIPFCWALPQNPLECRRTMNANDWQTVVTRDRDLFFFLKSFLPYLSNFISCWFNRKHVQRKAINYFPYFSVGIFFLTKYNEKPLCKQSISP